MKIFNFLQLVRVVSAAAALASLTGFAAAQERVTVGALRLASNGPLFLAASKGYFKEEGLDVELKYYDAAQPVAAALAAGEIDLGATAFTASLFNLAGKGAIKVIAAGARERNGFEGNEILASNAAYAKGLRKIEDLAGKSIGITQLGSSFHYQAGQIARIKRFDLKSVTLKPLQTLGAMAAAVSAGQVDAVILPAQLARDLLLASQAKLVGWYSDVDEQQLSALFASQKTIAARRTSVEKFVRAYQRGAADYAAALLRKDRYGKRVSDANSRAAALIIARYIAPSASGEQAAALIEGTAYYIDPRAKLDVADISAQVAWYKSQGLVDAGVDVRTFLDLSFVK
jgi:NitT/TauT family transport system substrate-binding protein